MILVRRGIREWLRAPFRRKSIMSPLSFALSMQQAFSRRWLLTASGALVVAGTSSSALAQTVLGAGKTPRHLRFLQPDASSKQAGYSPGVAATVPRPLSLHRQPDGPRRQRQRRRRARGFQSAGDAGLPEHRSRAGGRRRRLRAYRQAHAVSDPPAGASDAGARGAREVLQSRL